MSVSQRRALAVRQKDVGMKTILLGCVVALAKLAALAQDSTLLLEKKIALPNVQGKLDHLAVDEAGNRLFVAATGDHSVQVIDLESGNVIQRLTGMGKPHGLAWVASSHSLYSADGIKGTLNIYQGAPLALMKSIALSEDADDMVYDAMTGMLYVGHGGSDTAHPGQIAVINTKKQTVEAGIPTAAHPEALVIDPSTDRVFVNVAGAAEVAVIDGRTGRQSTVWKLTGARDNVPLAYDEEQHVLFVACRTPARLLLLDGASGKELAELPTDSGVDDLFYDALMHRVYLIAGSGEIDVYKMDANKNLTAAGVMHTAAGAKTGLFIPSRKALYVGVPGSGQTAASILVYSTR
jgi:DNA-binding beta-propeller fold protein YncE